MRRNWLVWGTVAAVGVGLWFAGIQRAGAFAEFRKVFVTEYVKADSSNPRDKAFAADCDKAKCTICHVGKVKKNRNAYGKALAALLTEDDKEDTAKIRQSLEKVSGMKVNAKDPNSPTFGDCIRSGKLPCAPK
jgi:hypothetical protein